MHLTDICFSQGGKDSLNLQHINLSRGTLTAKVSNKTIDLDSLFC